METMLTDGNVVWNMAELKRQDKTLWQKICDWFKKLVEDLNALVNTYKGYKPDSVEGQMVSEMQDVIQTFEALFAEALVDAGENYQAVGKVQKNTAQEGGVKYSLNSNAKNELHKALYDINYENEVLLRDESPSIMLAQKGVKNLPMAMNASHIRENVFTEAEAKKLGLRIDAHTHYHGIGEDFFLQIIDGLDNVKEAYRGTKNAKDPARREKYFLLVSEFKDKDGNTINVPVYVDETAQFNRVFLKVNKISTVFGRDAFRDYINRQIANGDLVRIKNRSNQSSEHYALIAQRYRKDASADNIHSPDDNVKKKFSDRDPATERANRVLQRENAKLKQDVTQLRELLKLQRKITNGTKFTKSSVDAAAGYLMKTVGAKGTRTELAAHLNSLYEYIAEGNDLSWESVKEHAAPAVEWLLDNSRTEKYTDDYAREVLHELRTSRVYLDEKQKAEAAYLYESYGEFRKQAMGSIIITDKDSVSLDSKWAELSQKYPSTFDPDISSNDMPMALLGRSIH